MKNQNKKGIAPFAINRNQHYSNGYYIVRTNRQFQQIQKISKLKMNK